jgi:hypothetical protein
MEEIEILQQQLKQKEGELLKSQLELIDTRLTNLTCNQEDHETRLRIVETSRIRFETLAWLAFGGGFLSLINIISQLLHLNL